MTLLIPVLFCTGIVIWDVYFSPFTSIEQQRIAALVHSLAAIAAIIVWMIHVYAAIWVKGSIRSMTHGLCHAGLGVAASSQMVPQPRRHEFERPDAAN